MAIITGQRLSNLSTLALGSTGTLFYVESANQNSFKMSETGLYRTMYNLHLSGQFQPKNEDWRFVHKTGIEIITGSKTFVTQVNCDAFVQQNGLLAGTLIGMNSGWCVSPGGNISIDWNNKILSGNWTAQSLTISGQTILTSGQTNNAYVKKFGSETISGDKSFANSILVSNIYNLGANLYGVNLSEASLEDKLFLDSLNWQDRILKNNASATVADWQNRGLSGNWTSQQFRSSQFILSGNAPATPTAAGVSGQIAMSGQKVFFCTGTNLWGYINITPWI